MPLSPRRSVIFELSTQVFVSKVWTSIFKLSMASRIVLMPGLSSIRLVEVSPLAGPVSYTES